MRFLFRQLMFSVSIVFILASGASEAAQMTSGGMNPGGASPGGGAPSGGGAPAGGGAGGITQGYITSVPAAQDRSPLSGSPFGVLPDSGSQAENCKVCDNCLTETCREKCWRRLCRR